ncbi:MFS transporter [Leuconostoc sp. S51]|uniref:MFS transporter n=2 Tax=unclassified Leuconostoc TaxID=2685106 RepID=UPI0019077BDA|nr:MFS transporter [Leuconostoc sp. S51]MBK0041569.1 MFS transporter [Leuconostoc sp. S51]MBK0052538.1 MFS transporter [Leuconostoc sp. S50]
MINNTVNKTTISMIVATALMGFAGIMSETAMNVTFPKLVKVFHLSLSSVQWVTTIYLLSVAIVMTLSSYINKRFTEKTAYYTSVSLFILGTIIGASSPDFTILLIGRVFQGLSAGLAMPLMFNIIFSRIPTEKLGLWMGFAAMILSLAPSLGPTYGGLMIDSLGWRMIFIFTLIIPAISLVIAIPNYENSNTHSEQISFDFLAFLLLSFSLITLLLAINSLAHGSAHYALFIIFSLLIIGFIWRSSKSKKEFLNITVFKSLSFTMAIIPFFILQFMNLGGNYIIPNYLQIGFSITSTLAGFSLLPGTVIGAFFNPLFGKFYDYKGAKIPLFFGPVIVLVSLLFMLVFVKHMGYITIMMLYIVFTFGRVLSFGITNTTAIAHTDKNYRSDASAIFQTSQQFAGALGTTTVALITDKNSDIKISMSNTLVLFIFLTILTFVMYQVMFKTKAYKRNKF